MSHKYSVAKHLSSCFKKWLRMVCCKFLLQPNFTRRNNAFGLPLPTHVVLKLTAPPLLGKYYFHIHIYRDRHVNVHNTVIVYSYLIIHKLKCQSRFTNTARSYHYDFMYLWLAGSFSRRHLLFISLSTTMSCLSGVEQTTGYIIIKYYWVKRSTSIGTSVRKLLKTTNREAEGILLASVTWSEPKIMILNDISSPEIYLLISQ